MKFEEFKNLIEKRNVLLEDINNLTISEIQKINKILSGVKNIPAEVFIKKFIKMLLDFTGTNPNRNFVEAKFLNGRRDVYIVDNNEEFKVLSYFPNERMVDVNFLWKKGINREMEYLMERYPELRERVWKLLKDEINYRKNNNISSSTSITL